MKTTLKFLISLFLCTQISGQTNPLWTQAKVKNYLPHMTVAEVKDLLTRSDMVIIPIGALEQHADHLPMGTDILNGIERCKLIAQERDILVAPILFAGQSSYHMGFAGTISLSAETILQVHLEAVKSLIHHGFKRFLIMNAHGGNRAISGLLVDQINQTTKGIAVNYEQAIRPFVKSPQASEKQVSPKVLDRHAGTAETADSMYLIPSLVQLDKTTPATITLPAHLESILPLVLDGDPTAMTLFLAEGLKTEETGKETSSAQMSTTGVWGVRDPKNATLEKGRTGTLSGINAAIQFIDRWNELIPFKTAN